MSRVRFWIWGLTVCLLLAESLGDEDLEKSKNGHKKRIEFSGYRWWVKSSHKKVGPGPNYFAEGNVFVDDQGRLHLKITKSIDAGGKIRWNCAEIVAEESFGYGTYTWEIDGVLVSDPNVVLGLFTWDDTSDEYHHREIDIELISTWGEKKGKKNAQFVVQPWDRKGNRYRFDFGEEHATSVHRFTWKEGSVSFSSSAQPKQRAGTHAWVYDRGNSVPRAGNEKARMNLWLLRGPGEDGKEIAVIIKRFRFEAP